MKKHKINSDNAKLTLYCDAPSWDGKPTFAIGDFSSSDYDSGLQILSDAISFAKTLNIDRLIGPMNGDTWHPYRFVTETDNSPAFLLEPKNAAHEPKVFQDTGFEKISGYFSAKVSLENYNSLAPQPTNFEVKSWDGSNPERLFQEIYALSLDSFANNAFYKPISEEEFVSIYLPLVPMIKKELVFIATSETGDMVGFMFGIPNYAEGPETKTAIFKTYASKQKGVGRHLSYAFHTRAHKLGYSSVIHALIHDDNLSALRSATEGAKIFRRYTLYGLKI